MGGEEGAFLETGLQVTFGAFLLGEKRKRKKTQKKNGGGGKASSHKCTACCAAWLLGRARGQPPQGVRKALSKSLGDGGPADEEGTAGGQGP